MLRKLEKIFSDQTILWAFSFLLICVPISMAISNISFYLLTFIVLANLLINRPTFRKDNISLVQVAVFIFIIIQVLSVLTSNYSQNAWKELREILHPILFLILSYKFYQSKALILQFNKQIWIIGTIVSIISVYVIFQHFTGIDWAHGINAFLHEGRLVSKQYRISGFFSHPLTFAYVYLLILPITAYSFLSSPKPNFKRALHVLPILFCALCIYLTFSRTALMVLIIELGLILFLAKRRTSLAISGLIILFTIGLYLFHPPFKARIKQMNPLTAQKAEFERIVFWKAHYNIFKDHPLLGVGANCSQYVYDEYYAKIPGKISKRQYNAHNIYLQFMADSGILGLISFLFIIVAWFFELATSLSKFLKNVNHIFKWRQINPIYHIPILFSISILGLIIGSLTQNTLKDSAVAICFWTFLALKPKKFFPN